MGEQKRVRVQLLSKRKFALFLVVFGLCGPIMAITAGVVGARRYIVSHVESARVVELRETNSPRQPQFCPVFELDSGEERVSSYCGPNGEFQLEQQLEVRVGDQVLPNRMGALLGDLILACVGSVPCSFLFVMSVLGLRRGLRLERAGKVDEEGGVFVTLPTATD